MKAILRILFACCVVTAVSCATQTRSIRGGDQVEIERSLKTEEDRHRWEIIKAQAGHCNAGYRVELHDDGLYAIPVAAPW